MFATVHIGPSLDFMGFMQDVGCVTTMPTAVHWLYQHITQAISNVGRDMLQRMWEGLNVPFEYTEGIQGET